MSSPQADQGLERSFADFLGRLAGEASCPELITAASHLARARFAGHICVDIEQLAAGSDVATFSAKLLATPVVGGPGAQTPLILEGGYLYLQRYQQAEEQVAAFILHRLGQNLPRDMAALRQGLRRFFDSGQEQVDWQQVAALAALTRSFTVISGGPGTGKTTTVAKILAIYQELHQGREAVIRLAAPTGKAAARLQDSILQAKQRLDLGEPVRSRIPHKTVTVHRLLGLADGLPRYHQNHKLAADLVVVDEASMVDLPLMSQLMAALPDSCQLILLGDHFQLSSVQPGAVLGDMCSKGEGFTHTFLELARGLKIDLGPVCQRRNELADSIVTLQDSYRFASDSGIRLVSEAVKAGDSEGALAVLESDSTGDISRRDYGTSCEREVEELLYPAYQEAAWQDPAEQLAALARLGVLCAHRSGPAGVEAVNTQLIRLLHGEHGSALPLYAGLPIMIARNSYGLQLYNGDSAVMGEAEGRLYACFAEHDGLRQVLARRLPPYEPAYAMTVHKSQGSEFDRVVVVLPPKPSQVLGRELLYTALTRARRQVEVWGSAEIFAAAVASPVQRVSGLAQRLWSSGSSS